MTRLAERNIFPGTDLLIYLYSPLIMTLLHADHTSLFTVTHRPYITVHRYIQTIYHCTPLHADHTSLFTVTYRPYITVLHYMQTIHHCSPLHTDHTSLYSITCRPYITVLGYMQTIYPLKLTTNLTFTRCAPRGLTCKTGTVPQVHTGLWDGDFPL